MGTTYTIKFGEPSEIRQQTIDSILRVVNAIFSTYDESSYISAFNNGTLEDWRAKHDRGIVEEYTQRFVLLSGLSMGIFQRTEGAFDPSGAELFNLWGFAEREDRNPSKAQVDSALKHTGFQKMRSTLDGIVRPDSFFTLNFNAIAKGYGVDVLAEYFLKLGYKNFMIEIGGEVRAHGRNPEGGVWVIGVNIPSSDAALNSVLDTIQLHDEAVATSGNYRNFYYDSTGTAIGHTIDPRTGYPVMNELRSCSIIHPSCAIADAYATAAMVSGKENLQKWITADSLLRALVVTGEKDQAKSERLTR
ncbi:MAG: FAD:protein FMN transferase [Flavobacteriales bacterium]|nr:FAD:protein FMN transferase [Flavobacteriales bacterium]